MNPSSSQAPPSASAVLDPDPAGCDPDATASGTANVSPPDLSRRFPLAAHGTGLVLFDTARGELRAHWSLDRNDLERFGSSFPLDRQRPAPVLRLRRVSSDGASEPSGELSLLAVARERTGIAEFRVTDAAGLYQAELGLATEDGGWLMLARSNAIQRSARVGLNLDVRASRASSSERAARPPDADPIDATGLAATDPSLLPPPATGAAVVPLDPVFPLVGLAAECGERPAPGPSTALGRPPQRQAPRSGTATLLECSLAPPTYGSFEPAAGMLEIEAELRLAGRAPPETWIDLFGHPFRVGPGGRFQLTVRVRDAQLLQRALELDPPPELATPRED